VDGIDLAGGRWRLAARTPTGGRLDLDCDGLVLTGPGPPVRMPGQPSDHPRVLDGRTFWTSQDALTRDGTVEVCVIGNGETAGSITAALLAMLPERSTIELVSDHGVLYSRGESFAENRLYSDPVAADWQRLAKRHRREFLKRTDRGVFSLQVEQMLNQAGAVHTVAGRVTHLQPVGAKVIVEVDYEQERERIAFDWVVVAVGFDPMWFWHLLGERAGATLAGAASGGSPPGRPPAPLSNAPSATTSPSRGCTPCSTCGPGWRRPRARVPEPVVSWSARRPRARRLRPPSPRHRRAHGRHGRRPGRLTPQPSQTLPCPPTVNWTYTTKDLHHLLDRLAAHNAGPAARGTPPPGPGCRRRRRR